MVINTKTLFKVMQALRKAILYAGYNKKTNVVRIDSRKRKEMSSLDKYEFLSALRKLEKDNIAEIEDFPGEQNKAYQNHFQIKLLAKFNSQYKKLERDYHDLQDAPIPNKFLACGNLKFKPSTGEFSYGMVRNKKIKTGTAAWSILWSLMKNKNKFIKKTKLKEDVMSGWIRFDTNRDKIESKSNIENVIRNIRRKLKMGGVDNAKNKNIIEGSGNNEYKIICK